MAYSFIENVNIIVNNLEDIKNSNNNLTDEIKYALPKIANVEFDIFIEDLKKGTYYGYRKLDISLKSGDEIQSFKKAYVELMSDDVVEIDFTHNVSSAVELKEQFNTQGFNDNVTDTRVEVATVIGEDCTQDVVRFTDILGASNIKYIELVNIYDVGFEFSFVDTTSSLTALTNNLKYLMEVFKHINSVVLLSKHTDNITMIASTVASINSILDNFENITCSYEKISSHEQGSVVYSNGHFDFKIPDVSKMVSGGSASSVYTNEQLINGGGANG